MRPLSRSSWSHIIIIYYHQHHRLGSSIYGVSFVSPSRGPMAVAGSMSTSFAVKLNAFALSNGLKSRMSNRPRHGSSSKPIKRAASLRSKDAWRNDLPPRPSVRKECQLPPQGESPAWQRMSTKSRYKVMPQFLWSRQQLERHHRP